MVHCTAIQSQYCESESLVQIPVIKSNPPPVRIVLRCQFYTKRLWTEFLGEAKWQGMPGLVVLESVSAFFKQCDSISLIEQGRLT